MKEKKTSDGFQEHITKYNKSLSDKYGKRRMLVDELIEEFSRCQDDKERLLLFIFFLSSRPTKAQLKCLKRRLSIDHFLYEFAVMALNNNIAQRKEK